MFRVPAGLISDQLGPITTMLGWSLALLGVAAAAVMYLGVRALTGTTVIRRAAGLLTVVGVVTANAYLSVYFAHHGELISGPGARPVVALAQASWLLVTVAALLLLSAAVALRGDKPVLQRAPLAGGLAAGAAAALVAATVLATVSVHGKLDMNTVAATDIPPAPATVGSEVAYTITTTAANTLAPAAPGFLVPAGPGFVVRDGDSLNAYHGATGQQRWRFPLSLLPHECSLWALRSTGTGSDAVLLVECWPEKQSSGQGKPYLLALDAMTGQRLWSTNNGWYILGRVELSPDAVPVGRGDSFASLDPRTGALRWVRPLRLDEQCEGRSEGVSANARSILVVARCGDMTALWVLDGHTGAQRSIDLSIPAGLSGDIHHVLTAAAYGDAAVIHAEDQVGPGEVWLAINTAAGSVNRIEGRNFAETVASARTGQYPGPVLQLDTPFHPSDPVRLLSVGQGSITTLTGLSTDQFPLYTQQWWAVVGENAVTVTGRGQGSGPELVSVAASGEVTRRASPCGDDPGGVMTVPGALAVVCLRGYIDGSAESYDIIGLR